MDSRGTAAALLSKLQNKLKQIYDLSARNCLITWFDLTEEEIICHTKRPVISPSLDLTWKKNIVAFDENKNNRKNIKGNFTQIFPPFKLRVFLSIILFYITFLAMQRYISSKIYHSNVTTTSIRLYLIKFNSFNSLMEYEICWFQYRIK